MKKVIESVTPPSNTHVMWLDLSGDVKQLKAFINGDWVAVAGDDKNSENIISTVTSKIDANTKSINDIEKLIGDISRLPYPNSSLTSNIEACKEVYSIGDHTDLNTIYDSGIYYIGRRSIRDNENYPIDNTGEVAGWLLVSWAYANVNQFLILINDHRNESRIYTRIGRHTYEGNTWQPWKELNTIETKIFTSKSEFDETIDNGQYMGLYLGQDGFLPVFTSFTMTVINTYSATTLAAQQGLPNHRHVTQIIMGSPIVVAPQGSNQADYVNSAPSFIKKRDGVGRDPIVWGNLVEIATHTIRIEGSKLKIENYGN